VVDGGEINGGGTHVAGIIDFVTSTGESDMFFLIVIL
jgi:hypothetical protein